MISKFRNVFKSFSFPAWSIPLGLLGLCVATFGLFIPMLGVYWDDWETTLVTRLYPVNTFWDYFSGQRPLAAWSFIFFGSLLGAGPLPWHILTLMLRWLTVVAMWWFQILLWPKARRQATLAAFLFVVYPIFLQQPIASTYHQHWLAFALYFLSMGLMLYWAEVPRARWPLGAAGVLCIGLHLAMFEYFLGMELLRVVVLWLALSHAAAKSDEGIFRQWRRRALAVLKLWLPFLIPVAVFLIWRFNYSVAGKGLDPNRPTMLLDFFLNPLDSAHRFLQIILQDSIFILFSSWYKTLDPGLVDLYNLIPMALGVGSLLILAAVMIYLLKLNLPDELENSPAAHRSWAIEALTVGVAAILLGGLPIWTTGRQAAGGVGLYADRFVMAAMFGASLVVVALLELLAGGPRRRVVLLSILVGLSVGTHLRTGNDYRSSWARQQRIYWQLYWRAPDIQPHTPILSNGQLFPYVMPTFAFNLLYLRPKDPGDMAYYFYLLEREFSNDPESWLAGTNLEASHRNFRFQASTLDSLVLRSDLRFGHCLWVLGPEDAVTPYLTDLERQALPLVNLERIRPEPYSDEYPAHEIFGREPEHAWCYYFQKAELARQFENWDELATLGRAVRELGYHPTNSQSRFGREWMPFIEGFAHSGDWAEAQDITIAAYEIDNNYQSALCGLWSELMDATPASSDKNEAIAAVQSALTCSIP